MLKPQLIKAAEERIKDFKKLQKAGLICLDGDFFPSVHYPPITMYPPITEEGLFKNYQNPGDERFDIYVHIPFCIQQCVFCHYPVKIGDLSEEKDHYLNVLEKEMDLYMRRLGLDIIKPRSILVGGGTPTYLSPGQLKRFLGYFSKRLNINLITQFSYDVDPPTLLGPEGQERLRIMRDFGVDRLTIGIQSLDDKILQKMNRPHNAREAIKSIEESRKAGFKINIELIFGYPGETLENWAAVVEKAVSLGTEEIQFYRLKVIPYGDHKGFIGEQLTQHPEELIPVETTLMMKQIAISILAEHGYNENLRRVFTRSRQDYSHYADNQCFKLFDQIGFGLTGFSSLRDRFGLNTQYFDKYYSLIDQGKLPLDRGIVRSKDDQLRWCLILPLKNRWVSKKWYEKKIGVSLNNVFRKKIERLRKYGLLTEDDAMLKLTPLGCFFADEVCEQFHHPNYIPFPESAYAPGELNPYNDREP